MTTLHIRQRPLHEGKYPITLTLKRSGQADLEAEAEIEFALTPQEQNDLRWYMEDYLTRAEATQRHGMPSCPEGGIDAKRAILRRTTRTAWRNERRSGSSSAFNAASCISPRTAK